MSFPSRPNKSSVSYEGHFPSVFKKPKTKDGSKQPKTILQASKQIPVMFEGVDVTPSSLNPFIYEGGKERQISILESLAKETSIMTSGSLTRNDSQKFQTNILLQKQEVETANLTHKSIVTSAYFADDIVIPAVSTSSKIFSQDILETMDSDSVDEQKLEPPIPQQIYLNLKETITFSLLNLPSCTISKQATDANLVEEDNKQYDFLTKGKGRNRKVITVGIQTIPILLKSRDSETKKKYFKNNSTYVSVWEVFDTLKTAEKEAAEESTDDLISENEEDEDLFLVDHKLNEEPSLQSFRLSQEEKQIKAITKNKAFHDALIVIERVLGNNCYNTQQKRFKGLSDPNPLRENIEYKYRLNHLWTYQNDTTEGRCVTEIVFNDANEDIVAVAYGKYYYNDRNCTGLVMIWNIKNPQQPEREYFFAFPVTSVAFSKNNPNLLAVGFYNGHINIVDVSKKELNVIREDFTFFEPLWSVVWFQQGGEEDILASFGDGRVCRYQITTAQILKRTQVMTTAAAEGKLKGIKYLKKCEGKDISISGYDQARCLALHPTDPFTYFVGTSEGVIHRCSTNYYNEHMDLFKAHDGAIHCIRFSPFANKLYTTCGDDFRFNLWVDSISEPLIISAPSILPVLDADWSPEHPTIIASIRGADILIWDFQRKMYQSQSIQKSPSKVMNTVCRFTLNGRCLMVGDMLGNVHVYSLEDMPISPFFSENLISQSLKRLLITKPDLLKKLRKGGSLNFDKKNFSKYFN